MINSNDKIKFVKNGISHYCQNNQLKTGDGFGESGALFWEEVKKQKPEQIVVQSNTNKNIVCKTITSTEINSKAETILQTFTTSFEQTKPIFNQKTYIPVENKTNVEVETFTTILKQINFIQYLLTHTQPVPNKTQATIQNFVRNLYQIGYGIQATPNEYSVAIKLDNIFYVYYNGSWLETTESDFHSIGLTWTKLGESECKQLTNKLFNYNGEIQIYCATEYAKKFFKYLLIEYAENAKPVISNPQLIIDTYKKPIIITAQLEDAEKHQLQHRLLVKRPQLYRFGHPNAYSYTNNFVIGTTEIFKKDFIIKIAIDINTYPEFDIGVYNANQHFLKIYFAKTYVNTVFDSKSIKHSNNFLLEQWNNVYVSYIAATRTLSVFFNQTKTVEYVITYKLNKNEWDKIFNIKMSGVSINASEIYMYENISSIQQIENKLSNSDYTGMLFGYKPNTEQHRNLQVNGNKIITQQREAGFSLLQQEVWEPITEWQSTTNNLFAHTTFEQIVDKGLDNVKIAPTTEWTVDNKPLTKGTSYNVPLLTTSGLIPNKQLWHVFADLAEPTQILVFKTAMMGLSSQVTRINLYGSNDNVGWDLIGFLIPSFPEGVEQDFEIVSSESYKKLKLEFLLKEPSPISFMVPLIYSTNKNGEIPLKLEVKDSRGKIAEWTTNIHYSNHSPIAAAEISNGKFNARIVDNDLDQTQITLLLNGAERLKLPYNQTPYNVVYTWHDNEVKLNQENTITAILTDSNGNQTKQNFNFIAKPYGLYFIDEQENFYTSNDGKIKMQLNFEHIVGGHPSKIKPITLINHTQRTIENIRVWSEKWCWFSTGPDGLSETREYAIDSLQASEKKTIYCFVLPPRTYQGEAIIHIFAEGR